MGHGAWRKRKEIISPYALGAMRYAVQLLITTPDSKGKSETLNQTIKLELFVIDRCYFEHYYYRPSISNGILLGLPFGNSRQ
jgi:hypothetical protein